MATDETTARRRRRGLIALAIAAPLTLIAGAFGIGLMIVSTLDDLPYSDTGKTCSELATEREPITLTEVRRVVSNPADYSYSSDCSSDDPGSASGIAADTAEQLASRLTRLGALTSVTSDACARELGADRPECTRVEYRPDDAEVVYVVGFPGDEQAFSMRIKD